jgi:hypothetical protein
MVEHAVELRRDHHNGGEEARVGYRLNQTHGKARGVTVDIIGPFSCRKVVGINGNIDGTVVAWGRSDSNEAKATNNSRCSSRLAT